jgi:hypothetical protein
VKERACVLVREWAEKLLGVNFGGMSELANFLVDKLYVDQRSKSATQSNCALHRVRAMTKVKLKLKVAVSKSK